MIGAGPGYFKWDALRDDLNVHCDLPGHINCRLNKTTRASVLAGRASQGRSVGLQLAWYFAAVNEPGVYFDKASHKRLASATNRFLPCFAYNKRCDLRAWAKTQVELRRMLDDRPERIQRAGEPEEPLGMSF